jgi:ubiquinone/menaquinone biosynthesis C-methylase UbiE
MAAWKEKRKVKNAYDVTAKIYDERYSHEQHAKYAKVLEKVDILGRVVLDVGCGSGMFFAEVASKAKLVIGVDLSKGLLHKANQNGKLFGNVFVLQADADHLPFRDVFFDAIFSFTVLQNMPKPAETLSELRRVANDLIVLTGLKKAFGLEKFMEIVEGSKMQLEAFSDEEAINCYIATLTK